MSNFRYVEPATIDDAIAILADAGPDGHVVAGGASLVPLLSLGMVQPEVVVGLRRLDTLRAIGVEDGWLVIGATATHAEIAGSTVVSAGWPLLAHACGVVGTVRIRNQGTLGGNLAHADPSQDPPPALLVLDAVVRVAGPGGERRLTLDELLVDVFETTLEPGDLIVDIRVPPVPAGSRTAYRKFLPRSQDDYATVAVAGLARRGADGRLEDVRIGLGGVGPRPVRAASVEAALAGVAPDAAAFAAAAAHVDESIDPLDDARGSAAYKRAMARVQVERLLGALCEVDVP
jgi:aerobic carbon-monoxide dehydrogenase medium subunit